VDRELPLLPLLPTLSRSRSRSRPLPPPQVLLFELLLVLPLVPVVSVAPVVSQPS
jgi:hypothetical protein